MSKHQSPEVLSGVYQHYKGELYLVLGLGFHTEAEEKLVIYIPLYAKAGPRIAARPFSLFFEHVEYEGKTVPRFTYIGSEL